MTTLLTSSTRNWASVIHKPDSHRTNSDMTDSKYKGTVKDWIPVLSALLYVATSIIIVGSRMFRRNTNLLN
jgi:hypothetical protein